MDCSQTEWLSNEEYWQQFYRAARQQHIPLSGTLELTPRCNLRCRHCYLGPQEVFHRQSHQEMSTSEVIAVLDDITAAGCLFLLITGGDPLMRRDFPEIYRHARENGLIVAIFTSGTMITERILQLFAEYPPRLVDISLYGATAATYEAVTGIRGSYKQCIAGIHRLLDHNIRVGLKTLLMTLNIHEIEAMKELADQLGVQFRTDAGIFPRFNGDKMPLELRVAPEKVVEAEFSLPNRREKWIELYGRMKGTKTNPDALYQCGAGVATFYINAYGQMQPCVMTTRYQYDLVAGSFSTGWQEELPRIKEKRISSNSVCRSCEAKSLCGVCPPFAELETGSEEGCSEYMCAIGHHRLQALDKSAKVPNVIFV